MQEERMKGEGVKSGGDGLAAEQLGVGVEATSDGEELGGTQGVRAGMGVRERCGERVGEGERVSRRESGAAGGSNQPVGEDGSREESSGYGGQRAVGRIPQWGRGGGVRSMGGEGIEQRRQGRERIQRKGTARAGRCQARGMGKGKRRGEGEAE